MVTFTIKSYVELTFVKILGNLKLSQVRMTVKREHPNAKSKNIGNITSSASYASQVFMVAAGECLEMQRTNIYEVTKNMSAKNMSITSLENALWMTSVSLRSPQRTDCQTILVRGQALWEESPMPHMVCR